MPLLTLLAAPALIVHGLRACPNSEDVIARLEAMSGAADSSEAESLLVHARGSKLEVTLKRADGWVIGQRVVARGATCDESAQVIAVVVASFRSAGEAPPAPVAVEPQLAAMPASAVVATADRPWQVDAAVFAASSPERAAPGLELELAWRERGTGLALLGGLLAQTGQRARVAGGYAQWLRLSFELGGRARWATSALAIDAQVALVSSLLRVQGSGFEQNGRTWSWDPGLRAGLRLAPNWRSIAPFLGGMLAAWPRPQRLTVAGLGASAALPTLELVAEVGLYF